MENVFFFFFFLKKEGNVYILYDLTDNLSKNNHYYITYKI